MIYEDDLQGTPFHYYPSRQHSETLISFFISNHEDCPRLMHQMSLTRTMDTTYQEALKELHHLYDTIA